MIYIRKINNLVAQILVVCMTIFALINTGFALDKCEVELLAQKGLTYSASDFPQINLKEEVELRLMSRATQEIGRAKLNGGGWLRILSVHLSGPDFNKDDIAFGSEGFNGSPLWLINLIGWKAASFLGFRMVLNVTDNPQRIVVTAPDAYTVNQAITKYNALVEEPHRIPWRLIEPDVSRLNDLAYVQGIINYTHPLASTGEESLHDVNYHLGTIFQSRFLTDYLFKYIKVFELYKNFLRTYADTTDPEISGNLDSLLDMRYDLGPVGSNPKLGQRIDNEIGDNFAARTLDNFTGGFVISQSGSEAPRRTWDRSQPGSNDSLDHQSAFDFFVVGTIKRIVLGMFESRTLRNPSLIPPIDKLEELIYLASAVDQPIVQRKIAVLRASIEAFKQSLSTNHWARIATPIDEDFLNRVRVEQEANVLRFRSVIENLDLGSPPEVIH